MNAKSKNIVLWFFVFIFSAFIGGIGASWLTAIRFNRIHTEYEFSVQAHEAAFYLNCLRMLQENKTEESV